MKYLVLLAILAVVLLLFFGRGRKGGPPGAGRKPPGDASAPPPPAAPPGKPAEMLACAHCGVHLPHSDAVFDVAGRPYCSPEHRVAGPR